MSNSLIYSCGVTQMEGKKRKLKAVGDGYVEMLVGCFGLTVNGYIWGIPQNIKGFFSEGSQAYANCTNGRQFGESDHPDFTEYLARGRSQEESEALFNQRLLTVPVSKQATAFRKFSLVELQGENRNTKVIGVVAELKPMTEIEKTRIHTPDINPAYSIRAFSSNDSTRIPNVRMMSHFVTYDGVPQGGVPQACKYGTPSLQNFKEEGRGFSHVLTKQSLTNMDMLKRDTHTSAILQSNGEPLLDVIKIKDGLGWRDIPIHNKPSTVLSRW